MRQPQDAAISRRSAIAGAFAGLGGTALGYALAQDKKDAPVGRKDPLKITKLETMLVQPRWLFEEESQMGRALPCGYQHAAASEAGRR